MSGPFPSKAERDARRLRSEPIGPAATPNPAQDRKNDELATAKAFAKVYGTNDGRIVLEHIMTHLCMIDRPIIAPGMSTETLIARCTAYDLGHEINRLIHKDLGEKPKQPKVNIDPKLQ